MIAKQKFNIPKFLKKYGWILLLLIMIIIVVIIQAIPEVEAVSTDAERMNKWLNFLSGFGVTIFNKMQEGYSILSDFANTSNAKYGAASGVATLIKGLAEAFVVIFMMIGLIKEGSRGEIDMDMIFWFRIFASTAIAVVMVISISPIMDGLYKLGDYVVTTVATGQADALVATDDLDATGEGDDKEYISKIDFTSEEMQQKMAAILKNIPNLEYLEESLKQAEGEYDGDNYLPNQNLMQYLDMFMWVSYIPIIVALFLMYSAVFELKIRQILAPLAVSTIAFEGARGSGVRFLKKYLACFLKIAIYFLVAWFGYLLSMYFYGRILDANVQIGGGLGSGDITAPGVMDAIMMLLTNIVCAMAMMQTGGIADEVIGA